MVTGELLAVLVYLNSSADTWHSLPVLLIFRSFSTTYFCSSGITLPTIVVNFAHSDSLLVHTTEIYLIDVQHCSKSH